MADNFRAEQVFNGTWGEIWIDGQYMAEATGLEARVALNKTEVKMARRLAQAYKVTGYNGTGTITLNKVSSFFINKMNDDVKAGRQTVMTIMSNLNDPDAIGGERIVIKDATLDELILANWLAGELVEEDIPFTFSDWDIIDQAI